jgi:copper chaperone CopZ
MGRRSPGAGPFSCPPKFFAMVARALCADCKIAENAPAARAKPLVRAGRAPQHGGMATPSPRTARRIATVLVGAGILSLVGFLAINASARRAELGTRRAAFVAAAAAWHADGARVVRIDVEGMTCDGCARTVEEELRKVAGVTSCRVDRAGRVAEVRLAGADVPTDALLAAVTDAGYEARLEPDPPAAP